MARGKYTRQYIRDLKTKKEMLEVAMELGVPKIVTADGWDLGTPKECLSRSDIDWSKDVMQTHTQSVRLTERRLLTIICDHIDGQLTDGIKNPI